MHFIAMNIVWIIVKIAIQTAILSFLFRQTYRWVFVFWRKPVAWLCMVTRVTVFAMALAFELSWNPSAISSAAIFAVILNWPLPAPRGIPKLAANEMLDSIYDELGIVRGRLKYRLGLLSFAFFSGATYILLFAESCTHEGQCVHLVQGF
jgi:hypothetical protein